MICMFLVQQETFELCKLSIRILNTSKWCLGIGKLVELLLRIFVFSFQISTSYFVIIFHTYNIINYKL